MTPRPKSETPKSTLITVRIVGPMYDAMREVQERDGVPISEQVRRGIDLWLKKKGVMKSDRKRVVTRKRP